MKKTTTNFWESKYRRRNKTESKSARSFEHSMKNTQLSDSTLIKIRMIWRCTPGERQYANETSNLFGFVRDSANWLAFDGDFRVKQNIHTCKQAKWSAHTVSFAVWHSCILHLTFYFLGNFKQPFYWPNTATFYVQVRAFYLDLARLSMLW